MGIKNKTVIVCGNSDAFGSEIGHRFTCVEDGIQRSRQMKEPHEQAWPSQMNQFGLKVINCSQPGSGLLTNVTKALQMHQKMPEALYLIDIALIDHLAKEERNFSPRNAVLFMENALEMAIHSFDKKQQIFLINEQRKLLHQLNLNFKFIMFGNPLFDFKNFVPDRERKNYVPFLRESLLNPLDLPDSILKDCLLPKPYFHYFPENEISEFSHITSASAILEIARLMAERIHELFQLEPHASQ